MTDEEIIELYWDRNEDAIHQSDVKYGSYCRTVANNILHDAEDTKECVNDTWLRTWLSIPPTHPMNLKVFLAKITRNLAFDRYRSLNTQKRGGGQMPLILDELTECVAADNNVEEEVNARVLADNISAFLYGLKRKDADLFVRRYFYAESIEALGKKFHMTKNNVAVNLSRTRNKLKKYLQEEGYAV